jgi:hypothetical protein
MLAQKIALETDELATLAVANRLAPVATRAGRCGWSAIRHPPRQAGMNDRNAQGVLHFSADRALKAVRMNEATRSVEHEQVGLCR